MIGTYIAFVDSHGEPDRLRSVVAKVIDEQHFGPVFAGPNVLVLGTDTLPHRLLGDRGVLVGSVFPDRDADLDKLASVAVSSGGRLLIDDYWGDYLAIMGEHGDGIARIVRSPSAGRAAFAMQHDGVTIISSDIGPLARTLSPDARIDWKFVGEHLAYPHLRVRRTGISGVTEIFPGECLCINKGGATSEILWSPWKFVEPHRQFQTMAEAAPALRDAIVETSQAYAAGHHRIIVELSGGLDSSIVATSLANAAGNRLAVNVRTPRAEGDERVYARQVAAATATQLDEREVGGVVDLADMGAARSARPGLPAILQSCDSEFAAAARTFGADGFFSGTGGDSVFCALGSAAPAADALRTHGPGGRFFAAVRDLAVIHRSHVWTVAWMALRQARRRGPPKPWPRSTEFLSAARLPERPPHHPWLDEPAGTLPGARAHVRSILAALAHLDGYPRQAIAPSVFPLLSQPVVETCLRIPTWLWVTGGSDRAVARSAFADALPDNIVKRRTKGAIDAYCARSYQHSRPALRDFLLGGHLALAGLLDRKAIDAYLAQVGPMRDMQFYNLLPIIDTERWLQAWSSPHS